MITYGFYDSINHDRRYNSIQFGSIFDGVINDGIFMSIGTCFRVIPAEDMMVLVGAGRAWFDHTWTYNDAPLPLTIPQSEVLLDRIDAIVLDIDQNQESRKNDVILIKGTPSKTPQQPTLISSSTHHQYPLAYISVRAGVTSVRTADITSMVGTDATPYVTGILETVSIDSVVDQWEDQWDEWYEDQVSKMEESTENWETEWHDWYEEQTTEFLTWTNEYKTDMNATAQNWKSLWNSWFYYYVNQSQNGLATWISDTEAAFLAWWESIKMILDENCCSNLADAVTELDRRVSELEVFKDAMSEKQELYTPIYDTSYNTVLGMLTNQDNIEITNELNDPIDAIGESNEPILDDEMKQIQGTVKLVVI